MSSNDYSILEQIISIGGHVKMTIDTSTGEVLSEGARDARRAEDCPRAREEHGQPSGGRLLSTSHISPFFEWVSGASVFKVSTGSIREVKGGGKRGIVKGFSDDSRRRLMRTIASIRHDAPLPAFVTLTYPDQFPEPKQSKKHLDKFLKRLRRKFPDVGLVWKLEPQERGAPHYHMLVWSVAYDDLRTFVPLSWYKVAGGADPNHLKFHMGQLGNEHCVTEVRSYRGVLSYASKYLGKTFEVAGWDSKQTGRFWSVVGRENVPFGEPMVMRVSLSDAKEWMRYQKRFSGVRLRPSSQSFTIFCNADTWVNNIMRTKGGDDIESFE